MKCPFRNFKDCSRDCQLYTYQERKYAHKVDSTKAEGCVFVMMLQELTNHSGQNSMQHSQTGEVANNVLYQALAMLGSKEGAGLLKKKLESTVEDKGANTGNIINHVQRESIK